MGLFQKLRRLAPATSRAVYNMHDEVMGRLHAITSRLEKLERESEKTQKLIEGQVEKNQIYLELLYRQENEDPYAARRRMFAAIPPAEGPIRLHQLANARLMNELDQICSELGIEYWFAYGTLVAALSRHGFIPWDDDIDTCMMRDDIEKLRVHLEGNPDFQVTTVYDRYVLCKQMRFSSTDPEISCFIDLSIWDYATEATPEKDNLIRQARLDLMDELRHMDGAEYWNEFPYLFAPGSGDCVQCSPSRYDKQNPVLAKKQVDIIEEAIARYQEKMRNADVLCDKESAGAVAYSIDNIFDAPWRRILWEKDQMLPTRKCPFESYQFSVPNKAEEVMQECYPGSPFLPNDIVGHDHFARDDVESATVRAALQRFIDS